MPSIPCRRQVAGTNVACRPVRGLEINGPLEGFVLDGYPRTLPQAQAAQRWGRHYGRLFHAVIALEVDEPELVRRLVERGRRTGRSDDNEAAIHERLSMYATQTEPLLDFYRRRRILRVVRGVGGVDVVSTRIFAALPSVLPEAGKKRA